MKQFSRLGIRAKILTTITIGLVFFFLIEAFVLQVIYLDSFRQEEQDNVVRDIQRAEAIVDDQIYNIKVKITDWSVWDDSYNFVSKPDQKFIDVNLQDSTLKSLNINFMIFISSQSGIIYKKGVDVQTGKEIAVPKEISDYIANNKELVTYKNANDVKSGILGKSIFIAFASAPVVKSSGEGPIVGGIIFARLIDKNFFGYISKLNQSKLDYFDYDSQFLPQEFIMVKNEMPNGIKYKEPSGEEDLYVVKNDSSKSISAYTILYDYNNNPVFILKNTLPRVFYQLGTSSINFTLITFIIVSSLSLFFAVILLNKVVISKVTKLNKDVSEVSDINNSKNRLEVRGKDEFSTLALNINKMLDTISKSGEDLEKFKLAIDNTSDHIIMTDPEGIVIYANKAAEALTGYTLDEMRGNTPRLWGRQMTKDFYVKLWDTIKNKKQAFGGEVINKKKSGVLYPVEAKIYPILDEKNNVKFFIGVERDVTSEKKLADNLKKQNEEIAKKVQEQTAVIKDEQNRLFQILESMPVGVYILEPSGKTFFINSEGKRILGRGVAETNMFNISQVYGLYKAGTTMLYPSDELPTTLAFQGKRIDVKDIEVRTSDKIIPIEATAGPIFDENGHVILSIVAFKDISEDLRVERSKDEFFSIASHELRTPLTAIRGNTSLIQQYYQDKIKDKDLNEMIDDIHSASIRLIQIVNDFLNVSRLEQGKMEFKIESFNINELILKKIEEVNSLAKEKGILVNMVPSQSVIPQVWADKDRTGEVIINLLGNAIKYSEKNDSILIKAELNNGFIKVSVKDNGRGIPKDQQALLFQKFEQTGKNILTRDTTQATGLGLYISKLITEQMGGRIYLESSEEKQGSVFCFELPVAK